MSYVIYNIDTTIIYGGHRNTYKTERAAKAAITRGVTKGDIDDRSNYKIASVADFAHIEKHVERVNLMSGKTYMEPVNTPAYCSPSCESYWSM